MYVLIEREKLQMIIFAKLWWISAS